MTGKLFFEIKKNHNLASAMENMTRVGEVKKKIKEVAKWTLNLEDASSVAEEDTLNLMGPLSRN